MYLCKLTATGCNLRDQSENSTLKTNLVIVDAEL